MQQEDRTIQRRNAIMLRHILGRRQYESQGTLGDWGTRSMPIADYRKAFTDSIISSGVLPKNHPSGKTPVLVSLSANTGLHEEDLARRFLEIGSTYRVVAGDMANLTRVPSIATDMRFDGSFLPFQHGTISAILNLFQKSGFNKIFLFLHEN